MPPLPSLHSRLPIFYLLVSPFLSFSSLPSHSILSLFYICSFLIIIGFFSFLFPQHFLYFFPPLLSLFPLSCTSVTTPKFTMVEQRRIPEPIAVVGSSCRLPGGASTPSKLWELLKEPRDILREVPKSRFNVKGFYHPDGEHHGVSQTTICDYTRSRPVSNNNVLSLTRPPTLRNPTFSMSRRTSARSTITSSTSTRARPSPLTRSSACCSRRCTRAWRRLATRSRASRDRTLAFSLASRPTTIWQCSSAIWRPSHTTLRRAWRARSCPTGCRTFSTGRARRSASIRRARRV